MKIKQSKILIESKNIIESLTNEEVLDLLKKKWITPLVSSLLSFPMSLINDFTKKLLKLAKKYETTYLDIDNEIRETELSLASMIDELDADEFDKKGLEELQKLFRGE